MPGNDDASRAITLYCDLIAQAAIDGISRAQGEMGVDIGAAGRAGRGRSTCRPQPAAGDLGFEQLSGPRGVADDLKKLPGVSPAIEKKLNDLGIFHYSQIAGLVADRRAQCRRGGRPARPRRRLDRQGQGTDGRSGISGDVTPGRGAARFRAKGRHQPSRHANERRCDWPRSRGHGG